MSNKTTMNSEGFWELRQRLRALFTMIVLGGPGLHYDPSHAPHGNMRERYAQEAEVLNLQQRGRRSKRKINSAEGGPDPDFGYDLEGGKKVLHIDMNGV